VTLLAAMLLTGASCGGADSVLDETETADVDNCTLVTDEEVSTLVGKQLTHGEDSPLGCPFVRSGASMSEFTVRAFAGKGAAKDNFGSHSADTTVHEISGVGDSAAVLARDEDVNFLIVQKGRHYVQFVTTFVDDMSLGSPKLKAAQELALKALERIE
jgi:hypothetical protein